MRKILTISLDLQVLCNLPELRNLTVHVPGNKVGHLLLYKQNLFLPALGQLVFFHNHALDPYWCIHSSIKIQKQTKTKKTFH